MLINRELFEGAVASLVFVVISVSLELDGLTGFTSIYVLIGSLIFLLKLDIFKQILRKTRLFLCEPV